MEPAAVSRNIDDAIREQALAQGLPIDRFRIRAARSAHDLVQAFELLHEAYVGAKLQQADRKAMRITAQHVLRESVVFVAWDEQQAAGTVTVTLDSPAGLPLDKDYPQEMADMRRHTRRLAETGSLPARRMNPHLGETAEYGRWCGARRWGGERYLRRQP